METTPIICIDNAKFDRDRKKAYEHYHANSYGYSEYQAEDFCSGYEKGYYKAIDEIRLQYNTDRLREQAALHALQGLIAQGTATCSPKHIAERAVSFADALINELNQPKQ